MTSVKIAELKNNLSRYLRRVRKGETIRVFDRDEPIAELGPTTPTLDEVFARLAKEGKCSGAKADLKVWPSLKPLARRRALTLAQVLGDLRAVHGE